MSSRWMYKDYLTLQLFSLFFRFKRENTFQRPIGIVAPFGKSCQHHTAKPKFFNYSAQINFWLVFPLEKEMATQSSTLAWRIPWTEEPGELQSMGLQSDMTEWLPHTHTQYGIVKTECDIPEGLCLCWLSVANTTVDEWIHSPLLKLL